MRATSSTSGSRRKAPRPAMRLRASSERFPVSSVSMKPGAIALTVIRACRPRAPASGEAGRRGLGRAIDRQAIIAVVAMIEDMLMMRPAPSAIMCRTTYLSG